MSPPFFQTIDCSYLGKIKVFFSPPGKVAAMALIWLWSVGLYMRYIAPEFQLDRPVPVSKRSPLLLFRPLKHFRVFFEGPALLLVFLLGERHSARVFGA